MPELLLTKASGPLWVVTWPARHQPQDIVAHLEELGALIGRRVPFVLLYDIRRAGRLTPTEREFFVRFLRQHDRGIKGVCLAVALITTSRIITGTLSAIEWGAAFPFRVCSFRDVAAGEAWLLDCWPGDRE